MYLAITYQKFVIMTIWSPFLVCYSRWSRMIEVWSTISIECIFYHYRHKFPISNFIKITWHSLFPCFHRILYSFDQYLEYWNIMYDTMIFSIFHQFSWDFEQKLRNFNFFNIHNIIIYTIQDCSLGAYNNFQHKNQYQVTYGEHVSPNERLVLQP